MGEGGQRGERGEFTVETCAFPARLRLCIPRLASARQARQRLRRPPLRSGPSGDTPGPLRLRKRLGPSGSLPARVNGPELTAQNS